MPIILGILWMQMIPSLVHLHLKVLVLLKFFTHVPYMFLHSDSIPQQDCPIVNRMSFIILMGCLLINGVTERTIGSIYRDQLIYQHMYLLEVWRNLKPTQCQGEHENSAQTTPKVRNDPRSLKLWDIKHTCATMPPFDNKASINEVRPLTEQEVHPWYEILFFKMFSIKLPITLQVHFGI